MRTTLRRGALLVATALLALVGVDDAQAQVAYTANTVTSVYYREFLKDGRYFVFNNAAAADAFEKSGETGVASPDRHRAEGRVRLRRQRDGAGAVPVQARCQRGR